MINKARILAAVVSATMLTLTGCNDSNDNDNPVVTPTPVPAKPVVYGHRGASGYLPDHTVAGYIKGIDLGADYVEPDLVMTKDGILVCRHEPNIGGTTNVASFEKFADRKTTKMVDGAEINDWFVSDFTLAELKELKARQPLPAERSTAYDTLYEIPTFEEMIQAVQAENKRMGKNVGIIPEIKHSTFHAGIFGANKIEDETVRILNKYGYTKKDSPAIIQSFEVSNLQYLNSKTDVRLVQLIDGDGNMDGSTKYVVPYDIAKKIADGSMTADQHAPLYTAAGLAAAAKYADIIGPWKNYIVGNKGIDANGDDEADDVNKDGTSDERDRTLTAPTSFIADAHAVGLQVVPFTFRNEPRRLASDYKNDPKAEYKKFYDLGVDGLFTDFVDTAVAARDGK